MDCAAARHMMCTKHSTSVSFGSLVEEDEDSTHEVSTQTAPTATIPILSCSFMLDSHLHRGLQIKISISQLDVVVNHPSMSWGALFVRGILRWMSQSVDSALPILLGLKLYIYSHMSMIIHLQVITNC